MIVEDTLSLATMHRSKATSRRHTSSFTKFVARLQHTFTSKSVKSSTPIVRTNLLIPIQRSTPVRLRIFDHRFINYGSLIVASIHCP